MKTLRTPDSRFENLPDFPFAPNYFEVADGDGGTLRMHYLDEGPADGPVLALMHGEPSWSFLYRKMIPILTDAGIRCIVPDLVGFGKSDKPAEKSDYSYERHVEWVRALLFDHLDLQNATLFGQDWGGLLGLRVLAENPDRFARFVVGNTGLPDGRGGQNEAFMRWQKFSQESPVFEIGAIINGGTTTKLSDEVVAAYNAPFPDDTYKAGARIFPSLVPTGPDDPAVPANRAAWEVLEQWEKPVLTTFSDSDPVSKGGERAFTARVPGAKGQPHTTIEGAGHFLQEDKGEVLAPIIAEFIRANS